MQAGYLTELRHSWRPLLAAMVGLSSGMSMAGVITSTLAPSMVRDNRWDPAEFALVGSLALVTAFAFPFIGRLGDVLGVKRTALIGQIVMPVSMLAYSLMSGELWVYMAIFFVQSILAVTTTATVYSRLAVQYVTKARGLALAIVAAGPALCGIVMAPLLNAYVEEFGWRASYQALAVFTAVAGLATFLLIPRERSNGGASAPKRRARDDYPQIFRTPAFWILLGAMLLCNLPATVILVQLKLLVMANGVSGDDAAVMLTTVSVGMLAGRFVTGVALDRLRSNLVPFLSLALPSLGLFLIASSYDSQAVLAFAVFCVGFAFGAEGDILGFLVARHFGVRIYSSVMGLLTTAMSFSTASGAALLSVTMSRTGSYDLYLVIVGFAVLLGAALLLLLGRGGNPTLDDLDTATAR